MMSDFQKAISALRALGISVTVQNDVNNRYQIAHIEGDGIMGSIESFGKEVDQDEGGGIVSS